MSPKDPAREAREPHRSIGVVGALVLALLALGTIARLLPFADPDGRMLRQFPSEDGYLMQTIARNIALGRGMSTADGSIPTNGTQPLATLIYALGYWCVNADRVAGVAVALALQLVAGMACAWVVYQLARELLGKGPRGATCAAVAASVWYASPRAVVHGMNCLETGLYALGVAVFALAFMRRHPASGAQPSIRSALTLGALAGVLLWIRLDAAFVLASACLVWAFVDADGRPSWSAPRLREAIALGGAATVVISPWLIHNQLQFGNIMPISGRSELLRDTIGLNASQVPACLAEYLLLVVPIPASIERHPLVVAGSVGLIVVALGFLLRGWSRAAPNVRAFAAFLTLFALQLCFYYGLFFTAPYFFTRYLFPLSVGTAIAWAAVADHFVRRWRSPVLEPALATALVLSLVLLHVRLYRNGMNHMHFQVVDWVASNVPDTAWVGAAQSGTLGYFHDRTINLDGKVNPEALAARHSHGVPDYVLSKPIQYIADWEGLVVWATLPEWRHSFFVVVDDPVRNLAVLERRN